MELIAGLPMTEGGFDMIKNHVDLLLGKMHAVPMCAMVTTVEQLWVLDLILCHLLVAWGQAISNFTSGLISSHC